MEKLIKNQIDDMTKIRGLYVYTPKLPFVCNLIYELRAADLGLESCLWGIYDDGQLVDAEDGLMYQENQQLLVGLHFNQLDRCVYFKPYYQTPDHFERNPMIDLINNSWEILQPSKIIDWRGLEIKLD